MSLSGSTPSASLSLDGIPFLPAVLDSNPPQGGLRSYRILVVDDMPSIHQDMRKVLCTPRADHAGALLEREIFGTAPENGISEVRFEIDSAFQAGEAIELVQRSVESGQPYAVAFVDMRMPPGGDGLQTIVGIWKIDPQIQVVICSAYSDYSWREMIATTGETDQLVILRKPF
jgi:CheY-like chemotaxis protein